MQPEDRHLSPYSSKEKIGRLLWAVTQATVFRFSFHTCNRWRTFLLNLFGADVESSCIIRRTVRVECPWNLSMGRNSCLGDCVIAYCLGTITIGERVSISQHAHLCAGTHDYTKPELPLLRLPIVIQDDVWIAADAFVGPNVTIGRGAILGARAVAMKSLEALTIYAGNPAKPVKSREMPSLNETTGS
ncbi:MAG: putative colanic acid biosynthesis acetyltransferase [Planctomycetes bacterium]|nr:putative colanic acid biosynthesis acetyltransferase [Planctomycetota bacterium]